MLVRVSGLGSPKEEGTYLLVRETIWGDYIAYWHEIYSERMQ